MWDRDVGANLGCKHARITLETRLGPLGESSQCDRRDFSVRGGYPLLSMLLFFVIASIACSCPGGV